MPRVDAVPCNDDENVLRWVEPPRFPVEVTVWEAALIHDALEIYTSTADPKTNAVVDDLRARLSEARAGELARPDHVERHRVVTE